MTDWIFYEEMARDLMRDAYRYDADTKNLKDAEVKRFAKQIGVNGKTLLVAYRNVKYKFNPASEFDADDYYNETQSGGLGI